MAVLGVRVVDQWSLSSDRDLTDVIQRQRGRRRLLQRVDINTMSDARDAGWCLVRSMLQQVFLARKHGRNIVHPHHHGVNIMGNMRLVIEMHEHVAARAVDFVGKGEGDRKRGRRFGEVAVETHDARDRGCLARRQHHHAVARLHAAARDRAGESAKIEVGSIDPLHGKAEINEVSLAFKRHSVEVLEQRRPLVPRHRCAAVHNIVPDQRRHRNEAHAARRKLGREGGVLAHDLIKALLRETNEIHLVDRDDDVADSQQARDVRMTPRLYGHAVARINQQDGEVAVARARCHVAGELFVSWRVGDDVLARRRGEVSIRNIDGDALLAFAAQSVDEERQIKFARLRAHRLRVAGGGGQRVLVNHVGVVQQAADERALAVIDRPAGQKAQQLLVLMAREVGLDVALDELVFGCVPIVAHQK